MKLTILLITGMLSLQFTGCTQNSNTKTAPQRTGGRCEGCEVIWQSPVPFEKLGCTDTLPDYNEQGPKLVISGIVYKADGKTAAKDVIGYIYHTDQGGHYTNKYNEKGWAGKHGYIKGWIKTNEKGEYKFYTLKPAPYPGTNIPAHIHPVIIEPGKNEYYIDECRFEGDPFLTASERKRQELRGGSGIILLEKKGDMLYGKRNIILGLNIPGYTE
jgi:protocatechuate 3,4-dioxygenase, beta subunit